MPIVGQLQDLISKVSPNFKCVYVSVCTQWSHLQLQTDILFLFANVV